MHSKEAIFTRIAFLICCQYHTPQKENKGKVGDTCPRSGSPENRLCDSDVDTGSV